MQYGPFWQAKYLRRAPEYVRRELLLARKRPGLVGLRLGKDTPFLTDVPPTSFSPITSGSETNLWTPDVWTTVPAGDASPGTVYRVCFGGIYSNRTTTTPASTWTPRWGRSATPASNVSLGATGAVYSGAALSNNPLFGEFVFAIRTIGTGGVGTGNGVVIRGTGSSGAGIVSQPMGGTLASIDTTVAGGLIVSHLWGATNASNTLTVQWVYMSSMN